MKNQIIIETRSVNAPLNFWYFIFIPISVTVPVCFCCALHCSQTTVFRLRKLYHIGWEDELGGMWKEAVVVCFKALLQTSGVTEERHGKLKSE
jgi:hypothetical protein